MMAERPGIRALPKSTARVIASSQVISSVVSVVKELVENSLDAGGSNIEIRLENYGLDKIEVRDNGSGISLSDAEFMGRPHYTSKLSETQDLETLTTYGFRGEALGSLCSVADVAITTKTASDEFGKTYKLDKDGIITDTQPSHLSHGTTVVATQLFRNVPVRKQYYSAPKRKKEELRKVEDLLIAYSIIKYDVRFLLRHNRDTLWQKTAVTSTKDVLLKVFGTTSMASMVHIKRTVTDPEFELELYLPKPTADLTSTSRTSSDRCFIYINQRPVLHKDIEKTLKRYYCQAVDTDQSRCPMAFVSILVPPSGVDVNLEPNKTRVLIQNKMEVLQTLHDVLEECYGSGIAQKPCQKEDPTSEGSHETADVERTAGVSDRCEGAADPTPTGARCDVVQGELSHDAHSRTADCPRLTVETVSAGPKQDRWEAGGQVGDRSGATDSSSAGCCGAESITTSNTDTSSKLNLDDLQASTQSVTFNLDLSLPEDCQVIEDNLSDSALLNDMLLMEEHVQMKDKAEPPCESGGGKPVNAVVSMETGSRIKCSGESDQRGGDSNRPGVVDQSDNPHVGDGEAGPSGRNCPRESAPGAGTDASEGWTRENCGVRGWSRGACLQDVDQKRVEPVQILLPGARQPVDKTPIRGQGQPKARHTPLATTKIKQAANTPGQATLYDVVGSEPIKRPTTAFIYFSKEARPAVVESSPGADFREIAKIIGERWKALSEEERQKYEQLMSNDVVRYREEKSFRDESFHSGKQGTHVKRRKIDINNTSPVAPKLSPTSIRKGAHLAPRKNVPVPFSLSGLKDRFSSGFQSSSQVCDDTGGCGTSLVGELKPSGCWVGLQHQQLLLIVPSRAQEMLIYFHLMEAHTLPTERLESPILLSPRQLIGGQDVYETVQGLETSQHQLTDPYRYCTDPRLTRNGFSLRYSHGQGSEAKVEVISMATCINTYGLSDLGEILNGIKENALVTVTQARPTKVKHYLQGEAVRMVRQMPPRVSDEEAREILDQVQAQLPDGASHCFHQRPFLCELYSLADIVPSQA